MGTWAPDPFGNDTAADWVFECERAKGYEACEEAFDAAMHPNADDAEGQRAVAAGEALCRAMGRGTVEVSAYCQGLVQWAKCLKEPPSEALLAKAERALDRVIEPGFDPDSSWSDPASEAIWISHIRNIRRALRP